jgi:hypothetical protein
VQYTEGNINILPIKISSASFTPSTDLHLVCKTSNIEKEIKPISLRSFASQRRGSLVISSIMVYPKIILRPLSQISQSLLTLKQKNLGD